MVAIRIRHLGRSFDPPLSLRSSTSRQKVRAILRLFGFKLKAVADEVQTTIMAAGQVLQDISLDIDEGSVVCLAGPSGSGKSTLLKILAGVIAPSEGRIELKGRVSSLVKIGDNLSSDLSAVENIERFFSAVAENEAQHYVKEVIAFAELEGFEEVAVRNYSTGMTLRLSIALAFSGNPSILMIDDVLGVGDIAFQQKCVERLYELVDAGCTLVFASSDEGLVRKLATRVITLSGGHIVGDGPPTQTFLGQHGFGSANIAWHIAPSLPESDVIAIGSVAVDHCQEHGDTHLELSFDCTAKLAPQRFRPLIDVLYGRVRVFRSLRPGWLEVAEVSTIRFTVRFPVHLLRQGDYKILIGVVSVHAEVVHSLKAPGAVTLEVKRGLEPPDGETSVALIGPTLAWEVEGVAGGAG